MNESGTIFPFHQRALLAAMWCSNCQQDVPGFSASDADAAIRCPRCRVALGENAPARSTRNTSTALPVDNHSELGEPVSFSSKASGSRPPIDIENWELDADLRSADRLIRQVGLHPRSLPFGETAWRQIHDAQAINKPHRAKSHPRRKSSNDKAVTEVSQPKRSSVLAWTVVAISLMAFVCGGVLLGWAYIAKRGDLWNLGMPICLAGQAGLIVGLVLQLDSLWQSNRQTTETLDHLDGELHELRHATTLLTTSHSTPSQSFYAHMAEGAGPELLLADLKGQLDLLALKMAREQ